MKTGNRVLMLKLAAQGHGPISRAVHVSVRGGSVQFTTLEAQLAAGGYVTTYDEGAFTTKCRIDDAQGHIRAAGLAGDRDEALLHAVLGAVREEHASFMVGTACSRLKLTLEPQERQKAESRYIEKWQSQEWPEAATRALAEMPGDTQQDAMARFVLEGKLPA